MKIKRLFRTNKLSKNNNDNNHHHNGDGSTVSVSVSVTSTPIPNSTLAARTNGDNNNDVVDHIHDRGDCQCEEDNVKANQGTTKKLDSTTDKESSHRIIPSSLEMIVSSSPNAPEDGDIHKDQSAIPTERIKSLTDKENKHLSASSLLHVDPKDIASIMEKTKSMSYFNDSVDDTDRLNRQNSDPNDDASKGLPSIVGAHAFPPQVLESVQDKSSSEEEEEEDTKTRRRFSTSSIVSSLTALEEPPMLRSVSENNGYKANRSARNLANNNAPLVLFYANCNIVAQASMEPVSRAEASAPSEGVGVVTQHAGDVDAGEEENHEDRTGRGEPSSPSSVVCLGETNGAAVHFDGTLSGENATSGCAQEVSDNDCSSINNNLVNRDGELDGAGEATRRRSRYEPNSRLSSSVPNSAALSLPRSMNGNRSMSSPLVYNAGHEIDRDVSSNQENPSEQTSAAAVDSANGSVESTQDDSILPNEDANLREAEELVQQANESIQRQQRRLEERNDNFSGQGQLRDHDCARQYQEIMEQAAPQQVQRDQGPQQQEPEPQADQQANVQAERQQNHQLDVDIERAPMQPIRTEEHDINEEEEHAIPIAMPVGSEDPDGEGDHEHDYDELEENGIVLSRMDTHYGSNHHLDQLLQLSETNRSDHAATAHPLLNVFSSEIVVAACNDDHVDGGRADEIDLESGNSVGLNNGGDDSNRPNGSITGNGGGNGGSSIGNDNSSILSSKSLLLRKHYLCNRKGLIGLCFIALVCIGAVIPLVLRQEAGSEEGGANSNGLGGSGSASDNMGTFDNGNSDVDETNVVVTPRPSTSPTIPPTAVVTTSSPTTSFSPTSYRSVWIKQLIGSALQPENVDSQNKFEKESPQKMALEWMERTLWGENGLLLLEDWNGNSSRYTDYNLDNAQDIPPEIHSRLQERIIQRYALAVLYYSTTNGRGWNDDANFLSKGHECEWVVWSNGRLLRGVECDDDGRVITISLGRNNLSGPLPNEINGVPHLRKLLLNENSLTGSLPSTLTTLSELISVDLSLNNLRGTIPQDIGDLSKLTNFLAEKNFLTGTLPNSVGDLVELKDLKLDGNMLWGSIPEEVSALKKLTNLWLSDNDFTDGMNNFCLQGGPTLSVFYSDCLGRNFPQIVPQVECSCCTICCSEDPEHEPCLPNGNRVFNRT